MKDRLTTAPLPMERPQGYFVLFVGRRYYLRPILSPSYYPLERAKRNWNGPPGFWNAPWRNWNGPWPMERPQGVSKKPLLHTRYTRNRGGNVEQSWCFRGERLRYRSSQVPNASAKLLLFSDMAMGCPGCRALLVRIACNQVPGYLGYLGYPTCVFFLKLCYI